MGTGFSKDGTLYTLWSRRWMGDCTGGGIGTDNIEALAVSHFVGTDNSTDNIEAPALSHFIGTGNSTDNIEALALSHFIGTGNSTHNIEALALSHFIGTGDGAGGADDIGRACSDYIDTDDDSRAVRDAAVWQPLHRTHYIGTTSVYIMSTR